MHGYTEKVKNACNNKTTCYCNCYLLNHSNNITTVNQGVTTRHCIEQMIEFSYSQLDCKDLFSPLEGLIVDVTVVSVLLAKQLLGDDTSSNGPFTIQHIM